MTVHLAMIEFKQGSGWWLKMAATPEWPSGKAVGIDGFSGDPLDSTDQEKIDALLGSWGYQRDGHQWRSQDGGFVVQVIQRRG